MINMTRNRDALGRVLPTHGMKGTPEWCAWSAMRDRCNNPNVRNYHRYGGRGIRVCMEWNTSFEAFFAHVGLRPSPQHSIDRINNDKGYEPGNVRWATRTEQALNRSTTRPVIRSDGARFGSLTEAAAATPRATPSFIARVCLGRPRCKSAAGYGWRYAE